MTKTVLVVEDHPANLRLMREILETRDYRIVTAENGLEVIDIARDQRPDLILLDLQLPGASGLDIADRMRSDDELKAIPIVATTAFLTPTIEDDIRDSGCVAYLPKPFSVDVLLRTVDSILR